MKLVPDTYEEALRAYPWLEAVETPFNYNSASYEERHEWLAGQAHAAASAMEKPAKEFARALGEIVAHFQAAADALQRLVDLVELCTEKEIIERFQKAQGRATASAAVVTKAVAGAFLLLAAALPAQECGNGSPAVPVPECRLRTTGAAVPCSAAGAVRLWTDRIRPARPGEPLPLDRDSTQWVGFTSNTRKSGHEIFVGLAVVEDRLYVAYNAGLQGWSIADSDQPRKQFYQEGFENHFLAFPPKGEQDFYVTDVDAVSAPGGDVIALAAGDGVGVSIWTRPGRAPVEVYQDLAGPSRQVRLESSGGRLYAFAAVGRGGGVRVYDATAATSLASPCLDPAGNCGIYLGSFGENVNFVDTLVAGDRILVAVGRSSNRLLPAEVWEVDPHSGNTKILELPGVGSQGVALFEANGAAYVAAVEGWGSPVRWEVKIYALGSCCPSRWTYVPRDVGQVGYLTASAAGDGTPYLYYGVRAVNFSGPRIEGLFDLSALTPSGPPPEIPEVTDGGETYVDRCSGNTVDYWGDYYPENGFGLRNASPQIGVVAGTPPRLYRAARGFVDVHVLSPAPPSPRIFADGFESGDVSRWR